jgi:hypothetical protein
VRRVHPIVPFTVFLGALTLIAGFVTWRYEPDGASATVASGSARPTAKPVTTSVRVTAVPSTAAQAVTTSPTSAPVATTPAVRPPVAAGMKPYPANGVYDGRPPMFVMVSFDGAADPQILDRWSRVANDGQARFTFYLSMVYLLANEHKDRYTGPRHGAGESGIGFAKNGSQPATTWIGTVISGLQDAQRNGHELAMHFGGHWCGPTGINSWNSADWKAELDAVDAIAVNADEWNGLSPARGSVFLSKASGARTPCLEGRETEYAPVLKQGGYRYNASGTRLLKQWPVFRNDLWNFGFPGVPIRGYTKDLITVDYSINVNLVPGGGEPSPDRAKQISKDVFDGLMYGFEQSYYGNRAPFEVANHFVNLGGGAYNDSVEKFVLTVCRKAEVHCVTYKEVTDWLEFVKLTK